MKSLKLFTTVVAVSAAVFTASMVATTPAFATEGAKKFEASILGGAQALVSNDTGVQDDFVNIPLAGALAYRLNPIFAVEGELAWMIPVENSVTVGSGPSQDLKNPDVVTYQANVRADLLPLSSPAFAPYVTAGLGAMTFLSATETNNAPQLSESETAFAINFGLGANVPLAERLSLRADFRQFIAFPQDDSAAFSDGTTADPIFMPRGTLGVAYQF